MSTRGSYVHKPMVNIFGASQNVVLCNFLKILMVSDKIIYKAFRTHKTILKQNPFDNFYFLHYLPKLHVGFKWFNKYRYMLIYVDNSDISQCLSLPNQGRMSDYQNIYKPDLQIRYQ